MYIHVHAEVGIIENILQEHNERFSFLPTKCGFKNVSQLLPLGAKSGW